MTKSAPSDRPGRLPGTAPRLSVLDGNPPRPAPPPPPPRTPPDWAAAVRLAPVPVFVHERGVVLRSNDATNRLMHASPGNPFEGRNVMDFVTDRSRGLVRDRYASLHEEPRHVATARYEIVRLDGGLVDVEMDSRSFEHDGRLLVMTVMRIAKGTPAGDGEGGRGGTSGEIVPICSACKSVREADGRWSTVEEALARRTGARFSHTFCPGCVDRLFPEHRPK